MNTAFTLSWLDGEEVPNEDEEAMMKMMGFSNFDSTKVITTHSLYKTHFTL